MLMACSSFASMTLQLQDAERSIHSIANLPEELDLSNVERTLKEMAVEGKGSEALKIVSSQHAGEFLVCEACTGTREELSLFCFGCPFPRGSC